MTRPILKAHKVSKIYSPHGIDIAALKDISLEIEPGEIYGIIGLSGAGKSTLLKILSGQENPTSGQIFYHGESIRENPASCLQLKKSAGYIFQHYQLLYSRTAFENVLLPLEFRKVGKKEREKKAEELLGEVGLSHKLHTPISHLSGGEKQRVSIARALSIEPDILYCDEATSALDPRTTKDVLQLLKRIHATKKMTLVLITHQMEAIKQICQRVSVMDKGQIVEEGYVDKVLVAPQHPVTKRLLDSLDHDLPAFIMQQKGVYRLRFRGSTAKDPLIAQVVKETNVSINILSGWIDSIGDLTFGNLVVQIEASNEMREKAIKRLIELGVIVEELS